ncbi:site-specific integrase [Paenibacillus sp. N1-5-1-14]|uniref:site-specific integrase n=1 Tax=Paenibacillus radicibacter TaxID=2972488 RepID=UPI002158E195|nr:site-specific integrase [Paenibacillus radicibacter]MCR8645398.1 site-specific integrase [Paenibacillus radicibacter]
MISIEDTLNVLLEQANTYVANSKSANTKKSYHFDWNHFSNWCEEYQLPSLPTNDETYALYLSSLAFEGYKASTIQRRISSISKAHAMAGHSSPTTIKIKSVWAGIKRMHGSEEIGKQPLVIDYLKQILEIIPDKPLGYRDRAILLIGFSGAFRRSELVDLDVEDITLENEGLKIRIKSSKTDQDGKGSMIGIPYGSSEETCPVRSYLHWLREANITSGPVFRRVNRHNQVLDNRLTDKAIAIVVKRYVAEIGLDEKQFSGHSLRSGFATTAAMKGKTERQIMNQTRHRSDAMVRKYIRMGSLFIDNAASGLGL